MKVTHCTDIYSSDGTFRIETHYALGSERKFIEYELFINDDICGKFKASKLETLYRLIGEVLNDARKQCQN